MASGNTANHLGNTGEDTQDSVELHKNYNNTVPFSSIITCYSCLQTSGDSTGVQGRRPGEGSDDTKWQEWSMWQALATREARAGHTRERGSQGSAQHSNKPVVRTTHSNKEQ